MRLNIFGWIEALAFAGVIMAFISADFGWILIYSMALAIAASVIVCVISRKRFDVSCGGFTGVYAVGDKVTAELVFTGHGFCFLPFITVYGRFMGQPFTARCSLFGRRGSVKISLRAAECCLNKLEIDGIILRDMLGLISFRSPVRPEQCAAAVLPRIVEYTGPSVPPGLLPSDDEAEAEQSLLSGGMPGYEHREYFPGDSPRRINYKLSAKKQTLFVRKNESAAAESTDIILAPDADGSCAEQALALSGRLIADGGAAKVICGKDSFTAASPSSLPKLREWLAFRDLSAASLAQPQEHESLSHTSVTISKQGVIMG